MSQNLTSVVNAVRAVDSLKRIPEEYGAISFFGFYDVWKYVPIWDVKLCDKCLENALRPYYQGTMLRGKWSYLRIVDVDFIEVNEHPHCRCLLVRVTDVYEYLMVTRELF